LKQEFTNCFVQLVSQMQTGFPVKAFSEASQPSASGQVENSNERGKRLSDEILQATPTVGLDKAGEPVERPFKRRRMAMTFVGSTVERQTKESSLQATESGVTREVDDVADIVNSLSLTQPKEQQSDNKK
jgi:hypothetical protein